MTGKGFKQVFNLKGGIRAWKGHSAAGSATMGMKLLKGNEQPIEVIRLAYGMEAALGRFYASNAAAQDDADVSALLSQLADIETSHKDRLFGIYQSLAQAPVDREGFESQIDFDVMEGGFSADEFNDQHHAALQTTEGVLSLAMMLEAQAMDLYLRYADGSADPEAKKILHHIADEEKAHLNSLAGLMDQKA